MAWFIPYSENIKLEIFENLKTFEANSHLICNFEILQVLKFGIKTERFETNDFNDGCQVLKVQDWWHWCRWRMVETKCFGYKFKMLVTDLRCWRPISFMEKYNEKSRQHNDSIIHKLSHNLKSVTIIKSPT